MTFKEIRIMAKGMGINSYRMKKTDLVRAIQRAENNMQCYGTGRVEYCNEDAYLWRNDCFPMNKKQKAGLTWFFPEWLQDEQACHWAA